jgi:hypothetical protein
MLLAVLFDELWVEEASQEYKEGYAGLQLDASFQDKVATHADYFVRGLLKK